MAAAEIAKPNFNGCWQLDLYASDSMDATLKLQGLGWFLRKGAEHVPVKQLLVLQENPPSFTITLDAIIKKRTEQIPLDGSHQTKESEIGVVESWSIWKQLPDGEWAIESHLVSQQGTVHQASLRRLLPDGRMVNEVHTYTVSPGTGQPDGREEHRVKRYFNRIDSM